MALSAPGRIRRVRSGQEELVFLLIFQQALFHIFWLVRTSGIHHLENKYGMFSPDTTTAALQTGLFIGHTTNSGFSHVRTASAKSHELLHARCTAETYCNLTDYDDAGVWG
jgi:hypothetical protein